MKYSITSGECYSPKSPQVVIFPPRFPKQEPFNSHTDQKQFYPGNRMSMDIEQGTNRSSDPYMQIGSGNADLQSASTADLISQGIPANHRPVILNLPLNNRRHNMARTDSRRRNKDSESSEDSESGSDRKCVSKISFYIVVALALLAVAGSVISITVMLNLMSKCDDLERKLNSAQTSYTLAQQDVHTCLPCGELSQGPFEEENEELKQLILKEENGIRTCCARSATQLSIMLNLFAKRKQREACAQESLDKENSTASACKNNTAPVSPPAKQNGTISAHVVLGDHAGNEANFQPIRHWKGEGPGTHLSNINITAEKSRIVVPESGLYFLYSQVGFIIYYDKEPEITSSQSLFHVVYRYNVIYPSDGSQELLRSVVTQCWEKNKTYGRYTSYVGAAVELKKGDQLYVKVSRIQDINKGASTTYFGLFKID